MRVSWKWLNDVADLPSSLTWEKAAEVLTQLGLEVEAVEKAGDGFSGVVVAEVLGKKKHPNADKLNLVDVSIGSETATVVCGAPNVPEPGHQVLWARPGAVLPGGFTIAPKKIKGVESPGMLCAQTELGIGSDGDGIVVLSGATPGVSAQEALHLDDVVFELSIPANRGDCLGHVGVARELIAKTGGALRGSDEPPAADSGDLKIATDNGLRYMCCSISGLKVGPSPSWLQARLTAVGVRPISNIVDVTNYVMFELGQPMHAFDKAKLSGAISVRQVRDGESLITLDEQTRELSSSDLVIDSGGKAVALAGVMGGLSTQVDEQTTEILLESATFDAATVRQTARRLGLHSESSARFSRGVDPSVAPHALERACALLTELCPDAIVSDVKDIFQHPVKSITVPLRMARLAALSGIEFKKSEAASCLTALGIAVDDAGDDLVCTPPTFREDLVREVDFIEEVVRMHGFHKVPATLPAPILQKKSEDSSSLDRLREGMVAQGFFEAITYGFVSEEKAAPFCEPSECVKVQNPMSSSQALMRPSLLPNLLSAVSHNQRHGASEIALFELGTVFHPAADDNPASLTKLASETVRLCAVLCGAKSEWLSPPRSFDFFDLKGAVSHAMSQAGACLEYDNGSDNSGIFHPGVCAVVSLGGRATGVIGELHPALVEKFDIEGPVFAVDVLAPTHSTAITQMGTIAKFPGSARDLSILVDAKVSASRVLKVVAANRPEILKSFELREVYDDPAHIPDGKKALLWEAKYQHPDKTLKDKEVDKAHEGLVEAILAECGATRR